MTPDTMIQGITVVVLFTTVCSNARRVAHVLHTAYSLCTYSGMYATCLHMLHTLRSTDREEMLCLQMDPLDPGTGVSKDDVILCTPILDGELLTRGDGFHGPQRGPREYHP